jgi:DNA-binding transcriptional MerR regulator
VTKPDTLTSGQVRELARITYRQLDFWTREGYIDPLPGGSSQGRYRRWSRDEAQRICLLAELVRAGVNALHAAHALRNSPTQPSADTVALALDLTDRVQAVVWLKP